MQTIVGVFASRSAAESAVNDLLASILPDRAITFLTGECSAAETQSVATTDTEADGMGTALGAVVGGAVGAGTGFALGSMVVSLAVPGIGPILAAGLGAAALLGLGGAAVGGELGHVSEAAMDQGVPKDDVYFYRDLLKRGRSLVLAEVDSDTQASEVRDVFNRYKGEDVETARREWRAAA